MAVGGDAAFADCHTIRAKMCIPHLVRAFATAPLKPQESDFMLLFGHVSLGSIHPDHLGKLRSSSLQVIAVRLRNLNFEPWWMIRSSVIAAVIDAVAPVGAHQLTGFAWIRAMPTWFS